MAVTTIDPGAGALAQSIGSLGQALAFRSRQKEIRFQQLQQNPDQLRALSASFRAAKEAGKADVFLESIGLDSRFAQFFDAFQPGTAERTEQARLEAGLPEAVVSAEVAETGAREVTAQVTTAAGEAALGTDIFDLTAQNAVFAALREGRTISAELFEGLPELGPEAQRESFEREILENSFGASILRKSKEAGLDKIQVDQQVLEARLRTSQIKFQEGTLSTYIDYLNGLDQTDPEEAAAFGINILGLENPAALSAIMQQAQIDAASQARIASANAQNQGPEADKIRAASTISILNEIEDAVEDLEGKRGDQLAAAVERVNNLRLLAADLDQRGAVFPITFTRADQRGDLFFDTDPSERVGAVVASIQAEMNQEGTLGPQERLARFDELAAEATTEVQTDASQREKEELQSLLSLARGILVAEAKRIPIRGKGEFGGFPGDAVPSEEEDFQRLISLAFPR